jgi:hypothetical protein
MSPVEKLASSRPASTRRWRRLGGDPGRTRPVTIRNKPAAQPISRSRVHQLIEILAQQKALSTGEGHHLDAVHLSGLLDVLVQVGYRYVFIAFRMTAESSNDRTPPVQRCVVISERMWGWISMENPHTGQTGIAIQTTKIKARATLLIAAILTLRPKLTLTVMLMLVLQFNPESQLRKQSTNWSLCSLPKS